jgi:uncharacterized membrane protein
MKKVNEFLDRSVLPWPVKFLTHRFIILLTMALLIPLIAFAKATVLVLGANSYLNTMSVAVSSIVLLYATIAEVRDKQTAEMQERRAQEDHTHVVEMHQLVIDNMTFQHEEIQDLKQILAQMSGATFKPATLPHGAGTDLKALHPQGRARFEKNHVQRRMARHVSHDLGEAVAALTLATPKVEGEDYT